MMFLSEDRRVFFIRQIAAYGNDTSILMTNIQNRM
jgi:hypothetical protein